VHLVDEARVAVRGDAFREYHQPNRRLCVGAVTTPEIRSAPSGFTLPRVVAVLTPPASAPAGILDVDLLVPVRVDVREFAVGGILKAPACEVIRETDAPFKVHAVAHLTAIPLTRLKPLTEDITPPPDRPPAFGRLFYRPLPFIGCRRAPATVEAVLNASSGLVCCGSPLLQMPPPRANIGHPG